MDGDIEVDRVPSKIGGIVAIRENPISIPAFPAIQAAAQSARTTMVGEVLMVFSGVLLALVLVEPMAQMEQQDGQTMVNPIVEAMPTVLQNYLQSSPALEVEEVTRMVQTLLPEEMEGLVGES